MSKKQDNRARKPQHGGGPKTPEGKARSAQNSARHGLCAKALVIVKTEDPAMLNELLADYIAEFQPQTKFALDLVHELAACRWRMQRSWGIENNLFHVTLLRNEQAIEREFPDTYTNNMRTAITFAHMADESRAFALLLRYQKSLTNRFHQVLQELKTLPSQPPQKNCETNSPPDPPPAPGPVIVPPEPPKPAPKAIKYILTYEKDPPLRR